MFAKTFASLILSLCFIATPGQTPETDDSARLSAQVVQLYQARRYAEALPLAQKALAVREKNLGPEHPLVAETLHNLSSVQFRLDNLGAARPLAERAVKIYEQAQPPLPNNLAATLFLLGGIHYALADYAAAVPHLQQSLTLREKWLGPENAATLDTVLLLANVYQQNQQPDSAEFLYRSYIATQDKQRAADSGLGLALERLSCLLWNKGEEDEAKTTEQRSDNVRGLSGPFLKAKGNQLRANQLNRPPLNLTLDPKKFEEIAPYFFYGEEIKVRVLITEQGEVARACALYGPLPVSSFYENAARVTRFSPFTKDGQPVKAVGTLTYAYRLRPARTP